MILGILGLSAKATAKKKAKVKKIDTKVKQIKKAKATVQKRKASVQTKKAAVKKAQKKKPVKKVIIEPIELPSVAIVKIRYLLWSEKLIKLIMYISDDPGNNVEDIIDEKNNPESSNNSLIILNYV